MASSWDKLYELQAKRNGTENAVSSERDRLFSAFDKSTDVLCQVTEPYASHYSRATQELCGKDPGIKAKNREAAFNHLYSDGRLGINYAKNAQDFPDVPGYDRIAITNPKSYLGPNPRGTGYKDQEIEALNGEHTGFSSHNKQKSFKTYLEENYNPDADPKTMTPEQARINATYEVVERIKGMESPQAKILAANYFGNTALTYDHKKISPEESGKYAGSWVQPSPQILREGDGICADQANFKLEILNAAGFPAKDLYTMRLSKPGAEKDAFHAVAAVDTPEGLFVLNNNAINKLEHFDRAPAGMPSVGQADKEWAQKVVPADKFFAAEDKTNSYTAHNSGWSLLGMRNFGREDVMRYQARNTPEPQTQEMDFKDITEPKDVYNLHLAGSAGERIHNKHALEPRKETIPVHAPETGSSSRPAPSLEEGPTRGATLPTHHQQPSNSL